jgi:acyl transferase domain-containing protein
LADVTTTQPPVAIVGMAVLLPGAADLESYWHNLVNGVDSITDVPEHRWDACFYDPDGASGPPQADRIYCRRGGFVDDLAEVDPTEFGMMPNSVTDIEPDQLIALKVAASAIADAGGEERLPARDRIGVILGGGGYLTPGLVRLEQRVRTANQLIRTLGELVPDLGPEQLARIKATFTERLGPCGPDTVIGLVPALAASRIANRLDFRGPAYTLDAACASSLVAMDQAVGELASGRCDLVLAGGVHHCHDILLWSVLAQARALSPSQRIRPFDRAADGILIGEGTGVVALKRLTDAERDGDRVYAVLRGTGVASDGRGGSLFRPEPDGQALAVRRAWQAAGLDPAEPGSVGLLEASGTATPAGDQVELTALARVFGPPTGERAVIGSVKSMIGHTMLTAGVAGLIKAALAVHHGVLLPTLGCHDPHPALAGTRFRAIGSAEPWELHGGQRVRRAAVNAFGFGGVNAHVVLEQHSTALAAPPPRRPVTVREPEQVLRLAAGTPSGLVALLDREDTGAGADGCRLGVVGPTRERLALARRVVAQGEAWRGGNDIWFSPQPLLLTRPSGHVAFVFPGLEAEFAPRVDDVAARFGLPLPRISANHGGHAAGVVAVGRLLDRALRQLRITPDVVAGQSIGELTAMISAGMCADAEIDELLGSFDLDALPALDLVSAVLCCGGDQVADAIADREGITVSHHNSPSRSIVCGPAAAIDELVSSLRGRGVLATVLPFRSGLHTPMMRPYLAPAREAATRLGLHPPAVPIWSATTAAPYPEDEAEVRGLLVRHLLEPVRLRQLIEAMHANGVRVFVQVGVGQLSSLIGDTLRDNAHLAVVANSARRSGLDQLRRVATAIWVEGGAPQVLDAPAGSKPRRQPAKLNLSTPLVSLNLNLNGAAPLLARSCSPSLLGQSLLGQSLSGLELLTAQVPLAAELAGLLRETADAAAAVVSTRAVPSRGFHTVLRISTETMPYLRDHCLFRQREGWPDEADRWPVVPGATLIQHMIDAAEQAVPGRHAVAVHEVRLSRWLVAAPPVDVAVTAVPEGMDRVRVSVGEYARATIELGRRFPASAPPCWPVDVTAERAPDVTAEEFYAKRWIFHGQSFQGVTRLVAQGERHVRGVITTPSAPGGLLDNIAHLVWYWTMSTCTTKRVVLPVDFGHIRLFGPHPPAGTTVDGVVRFQSITDTTVVADMQLARQGQVWAHIEGWRGRRFDSDLQTEAAERFPETHTLSQFSPHGWAVLFDRWPDLASRELIMRAYLGAAERADHDQCPPRGRREWLLGRIAVKDAVRRWLWDHGCGPVFPAEIQVHEDERGWHGVTGAHGRTLPPLDVSLGHCPGVGVAIARPHVERYGSGVGIAVEEITERSDRELSAEETSLLAARRAETGQPAALWLTRFRTAKEAVLKAEGPGLDGRPKSLVVVEASATELEVRAHCARAYQVKCEQLSNPESHGKRHYVVALATNPGSGKGHVG